MKHLCLSVAILLMALVSCLFFLPESEDDAGMSRELSAQPSKADAITTEEEDARGSSTLTRVIGSVNDKGELALEDTDSVEDQDVKKNGFIKKVVSSKWLDKDPDKAGRRRVRIVETNFKYPHLRLEEEVWTDPDTGEQTAKRIRASVADHVMVGLKPGSDEQKAKEILERKGYKIRAVEADSYILAELPVFQAAEDQQRSIEEIEALEEFIDYAEPDWIVYPCVFPNDPAFSGRKMWGLDNPGTVAGTTADADIDAPEAWDIRTDASNVIVAVTDTGIQYNHEDLQPNMWRKNGNGEYGYDAYDNDYDPMDSGGHGTHCAGTIGARGNNGIGLTGVAWNVQLMGVRFLGPNGGTTSDGIKVINYARNNGAHIISASWGGGGHSNSLYNAIKAAGDAGIPFVAAAGNSSTNNDSTPHYPSSYDLPTLVAVASTTSQDRLSYFSCYGRYSVDIAAPGSDIWSAYTGSNSSYKHLNGTSMATPHVSGALALARAHFPSDDAEDLIARLYSSVDQVPALSGKVVTGGRLNVHKLLGASKAGVNNDDFENALRFEGDYGYWSGSNRKATREADEDVFSLPNTGTRSVWFAWKAPYKGLVEINVEASAKPLRVIAFRGATKGSMGIASDGGTLPVTNKKTLRFYCQQDQEYRILVDSSHATGQKLTVTLGLKPANDSFSSALRLSGDRFSTTGSNRNATAENFERLNPHAGVGKGKSLWWRWTPDFDGEFVITTQGSEFDTVLAVYTGANQYTLSEVATNDDRNALDWTSQVTFNVTAGTTYHIAVDGYRGDAAGAILLNGFKSGQLVIISQPLDVEVLYGESASFSVISNSSDEPQYQWFGPNGAINAIGNQSTLTITNVTSQDTGEYYVLISTTNGQIESQRVMLTQKLVPPKFEYTPRDVALLTNSTLEMHVGVTGTEPMSFQWYKDELPIPGATNKDFSIQDLTIANKGSYHVKATNSQGVVDSKKFKVKVFDSPWNAWAWRNPLPAGSRIKGVKYLNGKHVAFGEGGLIMVSENGRDWDVPFLARAIDFEDITFANGRFIAVGQHVDNGIGNYYSATSVDGLEWTISTPLGYWIDRLVSGGGVIIAYGTSMRGYIMRSTDGLSWTALKYEEFTGSNAPLPFLSLTYGQGKFVAAGGLPYDAVYISNDGVSWTKHTRANLGPIYFLDGNFVSIEGNPAKISTSSDAITWSGQIDCINPPYLSSVSKIISNGDKLYSALGSTIKYSDDGITWQENTVTYENADFRYVSLGDSNVVVAGQSLTAYGDNFAALTVVEPLNPRITISRMVELDNTLWSLAASNTTNGNYLLYSADGSSWSNAKIEGSLFGHNSLVWDGSHYWALSTEHGHGLLRGSSPVNLQPYPNSGGDGLYLLAYRNGTLIGCRSSALMKLNENGIWEHTQASPEWQTFASLQSTSRGFIATTSDGVMFLSTDGENWTQGPQHGLGTPTYSGQHISICESISKLWLLKQDTTELYVADAGMAFSKITLPKAASEIVALPNGIVAKVGNMAMYSEDGTSWIDFSLPGEVYNLNSKDGTLIGWGPFSILQTGQLSTLAPICSLGGIDSTRGVSRFANLEVTISAVDPENNLDRVELWKNGEFYATGASGSEVFTLSFDSLGWQHLEARAYDNDGGVGRSHATLTVTSSIPQPELSLSSQTNSMVAAKWGDGVVVMSPQGMSTSSDGTSWLYRELPFGDDAVSIVTGNDIIIAVQKGSHPNIWLSRNGIDWELKEYGVGSVQFINGWFVARSFGNIRAGTGASRKVAFSKDGIEWFAGNPGTGVLGEVAIGNDVFLAMSGTELHFSVNGILWSPLELTNVKSVVFDGERFYVIADNKVLVSNDGLNWSETGGIATSETESLSKIVIIGGKVFLISYNGASMLSWLSEDHGNTWEKIDNAVSEPLDAIYAMGLWLCMTKDGIYVSTDSKRWQKTLAKEQLSSNPFYVFNHDMYLLGQQEGVTLVAYDQVWFSSDGYQWEENEDLWPIVGAAIEPQSITVGDCYYEILGGKLMISKDGLHWFESVLPLDDENLNSVFDHNGSLYAYVSTRGWGTTVQSVLTSTNGVDWHRYQGVTPMGVYDVMNTGTRFLATAYQSSPYYHGYAVSVDGLNWSPVTIPNTGTIHAVKVLNGEFLVLEKSVYSGGSRTQNILRSADGITWTTITMVDTQISDITYGNGQYVASDIGVVWTGLSLNSMTSCPVKESSVYSKLVYSEGFFVMAYHSNVYVSQDGCDWTNIHNNMDGVLKDINGKAYLSSNNKLFPVIEAELKVTQLQIPQASLGVGDQITANVGIANVGYSKIPAGENLVFQGILSRDNVIGNGDDILMNRVTVGVMSDLSPNEIGQASPVLTIPELSAGGDFYLAVQLSTDHFDMAGINNIGITAEKVITVAEWQLDTFVIGSGQINQDFAALRYPHGSRVSLSANAGKGAAFSGWGGDAVGAENQITILMDGNKSVQANFSSRASLQVHVLGSGAVTGLADLGSYPVGATASIAAVPAEGWVFSGWSGASTGANTAANITMDTNKVVTATFIKTKVQWRTDHFPDDLDKPEISGDDADPDGDGLKNWQEYLHLSDPNDASSRGVIELKVDGGFLYAIFTRNAGIEGGLSLACQGSRDMSGWDAPDIQERVLSTESGVETIEARLPVGDENKGFIRLRYNRP